MKKFMGIIIAAALTASLTGCGAENGYKSDTYNMAAAPQAYDGGYAAETYAVTTAASYDMADNSYESYDYDDAKDTAGTSNMLNMSEAGESDAKTSGDDNVQSSESGIKREMLVYTCHMEIDTLDFKTSVDTFKNDLESYGGFIEQENYSDGGGGGRWYSENSEKWQSYTATVRVPGKNYDAFCNSAGELGDLRSKNASVQNFSQEYTDLATTLEIYEAKEKRYIALLADITEDEYAVAIERELTDIQIQIANIRTRMNTIRADVAYSYVYITINEVKEYSAEPIKTDTFADRLDNTLRNAGRGFLEFLEGLLFVLIYLAPYLVLLGIIVFIVVFAVKKSKARKARPAVERAAEPPVDVTEDAASEEDKEDKK